MYFQEGDILNGVLCAAGAVIGAAGFVSAIGVARGACTVIKVAGTIRKAGVMVMTAATADMTIMGAAKTLVLLHDNDYALNGEILMAAGETVASAMGTMSLFSEIDACTRQTQKLLENASCFTAGTKVLTEEGYKNIEDIEVGDYVYSTDEETGEIGYKEVLQVFVNETEVITHVLYEDREGNKKEIETTLYHPFWSEGEWKAAGTLKTGDLLTLADGSQVTVETVTYENRHTTVYNMEVEDYHTYYVGEDSVWVHNTCNKRTVNTNTSVGDDSKTHVPSSNTQVVHHPEVKAPNQVKAGDVTNYWDDYLGSNQTNINPRTGLVDYDRLFSADGTRSIRFGNHEMNSMGATKFHFYQEEWKYDSVNDVMEYFNTLIRIKE